jgi:hypothetical protein
LTRHPNTGSKRQQGLEQKPPQGGAGRWRLHADTLACGDVRVIVQRLRAAYWQPDHLPRSWGSVPLHRRAGRVCLPCADGEVLWLGAWLEAAPRGEGGAVALTLEDLQSGQSARIELPQVRVLAAMPGAAGPQALRRAVGATVHDWRLGVQAPGGVPASIDMRWMAPQAWSALSGRAWHALPAKPPPLPPRLG